MSTSFMLAKIEIISASKGRKSSRKNIKEVSYSRECHLKSYFGNFLVLSSHNFLTFDAFPAASFQIGTPNVSASTFLVLCNSNDHILG